MAERDGVMNIERKGRINSCKFKTVGFFFVVTMFIQSVSPYRLSTVSSCRLSSCTHVLMCSSKFARCPT